MKQSWTVNTHVCICHTFFCYSWIISCQSPKSLQDEMRGAKQSLTLRSSDERKPPIHIKHRSDGVFHIPDKMWKTSVLDALPFSLNTSSKCVMTLSTTVRSSVSPACEFTAVLSSFICRLCSSNHLAYSTSNAKAPAQKSILSKVIFNINITLS